MLTISSSALEELDELDRAEAESAVVEDADTPELIIPGFPVYPAVVPRE